jgi:metal-responsive CopG/Arc/MetJ family transcriptional regulator
MARMRIGVSLPDDLVTFADEEAKRLKTSRSGVLSRLLQAERVRGQVRRYVDEHGWDVAADEDSWRTYQSRRMSEEYGGDDW